jgi:hypothetical protein
MAAYLTARQTSEMHAAVLDYLASNPEFRESAAAFEREAQLPAESSGRGIKHRASFELAGSFCKKSGVGLAFFFEKERSRRRGRREG